MQETRMRRRAAAILRRVDQLEPTVALGLGLAAGTGVWWVAVTVVPPLAVWVGGALLVGALALAFSGGPVLVPEPAAPASATPAVGGPGIEPAQDLSGPSEVAGIAWGAAAPLPPGIRSLEGYRFTVVSVDDRGQVRERREAEARFFAEDLGDGVTLPMTFIRGGRFLMGSPQAEAGRDSDEGPQREISVGPFYLGRFTVTQAQWRAVAGWPKVARDLKPEPSHFKGDDRPVERVSWHDALEFCQRLSRRTGREYGLPSEAQWEYACRAGTTTPFHFGPTITPDLVNCDGNHPYGAAANGLYRRETTPVGGFDVANAFGLFDMHGNVCEWCGDEWREDYRAPLVRRVASSLRRLLSTQSDRRAVRGGSWNYLARNCRSACRIRRVTDNRGDVVGFRVLCSVARTR
jgi:formylglycine-generating enzyme required for sulfatase activity